MVDYGCNAQRSSFQVMWGCHMRLQSELGMQLAPYLMRWGCHKHSLEQKRSLMKLTLSRSIVATSSKRKMLSPYCIDREAPLRPSVLNVYQYTYLNCSLSLHVLAVYDSVGNPTHTTNSMVSSSGLPHSSIKACEY